MCCVIPSEHCVSGEINGKAVNEITVDPGNTNSLINWACARKMGLQVIKKANFQIELTNGQLAKPKGVIKVYGLTYRTQPSISSFMWWMRVDYMN